MSDEREVYAQQGFGNRLGFGQRPALLVIDFVNGFADPNVFGGGNIVSAIDNTKHLLAAARANGIPIAYSTNVYAADGSENGAFTRKVPALADIHPESHGAQIVDALAPQAGERIIEKHYASAFFGTDLAAWLTHRGVDTTIVTGCTTSGCVRATVVDAVSHGFCSVVPEECVGDRAEGPHAANLFDMDQKYADVMSVADVIAALGQLAARSDVA